MRSPHTFLRGINWINKVKIGLHLKVTIPQRIIPYLVLPLTFVYCFGSSYFSHCCVNAFFIFFFVFDLLVFRIEVIVLCKCMHFSVLKSCIGRYSLLSAMSLCLIPKTDPFLLLEDLTSGFDKEKFGLIQYYILCNTEAIIHCTNPAASVL